MLSRWPYQSGKVLARVVSGENDVERLQVRVELGILQMEVVGHPEGAIPIYESMTETPEALDEPTCLALQRVWVPPCSQDPPPRPARFLKKSVVSLQWLGQTLR